MDITEELNKYDAFFTGCCMTDILQAVESGLGGFVADFHKLIKFDPELADHLLDSEDFSERLKTMEVALRDIVNLNTLKEKPLEVYFANLPASQIRRIQDIRGEDLGKLFRIEVIIKNTSQVKHRTTKVTFECPSCGNAITTLQNDQKSITGPAACGCGRKGKFRKLNEELTDHQWVELQEIPERMNSGSAAVHRKFSYVEGALTDRTLTGRFRPGSRVILTAVPLKMPGFLKKDGDEVITDSILKINYVQPAEQEFDDIVLAEDDIEEIKQFAKNKQKELISLFVNSLAPSIYGYNEVKESIVLMLFGGVDKALPSGGTLRGNFHILLIGDPSSGKSQMLKQTREVTPKVRTTFGGSTTGVGLSAAVIKNDMTGEWSLEGGVLVQANNGLVVYDEFDKSTAEDHAVLHEALESQTVTVTKANINATLPANICLLAAANPKLGRFDMYQPFYEQINLPPALASRFDFIWPIRDIPDPVKDERLADFVLEKHRKPDSLTPAVPLEFFRKYVAYAKKFCKPIVGDDAKAILKTYFTKRRSASRQEEGGVSKSMAITLRHLDGLIRVAEARAKVHLRDEVTAEDASHAIKLVNSFLNTMCVDSSTGVVDVDALYSGVTASNRSSIQVVKGAIDELENTIGKIIPLEELERAVTGKVSEEELENVVERLRKCGDIMEPKRGFIQKL